MTVLYMCVGDNATGEAMAERKLLARVLCVSSFGDSEPPDRLASRHHHIPNLPAHSSAQEHQAMSGTPSSPPPP